MATQLLPTQLLITKYIIFQPSTIGHFYLVGLLYYNVAANGRQLLYSDVHCFYMLAFGPPAGPRSYAGLQTIFIIIGRLAVRIILYLSKPCLFIIISLFIPAAIWPILYITLMPTDYIIII